MEILNYMKKILLLVNLVIATSNVFGQVPSPFASYNFNTSNGIDGVAPVANGTLTNVTSGLDRSSNPGCAPYFNGGNSGVELSSPNKAKVTNGLAISAWIKPATVSGQQAIVSKWVGMQSQDQYLLMLNGNKVMMAVGNASFSASGVSGNVSLTAGNWYHIVATWDTTGTHSIYVNGVLDVNTVNTSFKKINSTSSTSLTIGTQAFTSRFFNGSIDDVKLYSQKLSLSDIQSLYAEPNPIQNGLVSKYTFNDMTVKDEVNNILPTAVGTSYATDRFGNPNKALSVISGTTHVNFFDSYDWFSTGANGKLSYSFWINFTNLNNAYQIILGKSSDAGCSMNERQILLRVNASNKLEISTYSSKTAGNYVLLEANTIMSSTQWYHVVMTYDNTISGNGKYNIYLDNTLQTLTQVSTSGSGIGSGMLDGASPLTLGGYLKPDGSFCQNIQRLGATFDDFYIYNKVLNATEVGDLFNEINTTGIKTTTMEKAVVIYPNPNNGQFTVQMEIDGELAIYNTVGQLIFNNKVERGKNLIDLTEQSSGIYMVQVKQQDSVKTIKIMKQ